MKSPSYHIRDIANVISAQFSGTLNNDLVIDRFVIDSRYRAINGNCCFVALATDKNDGHHYLEDGYQKGIRLFIVDREMNLDWPEANFLVVDNTLDALQSLAKHRRRQVHYPIVAITGSNGKTVVKEWIFQLLNNSKSVFRSPKSFNSQIGVALSLLMLPEEADLAIIEAGISRRNEMEKLRDMIDANLGVFTNVHQAHMENFESRSALVAEKMILFQSCEKIIYSSDYKEIREAISDGEGWSKKHFIAWSFEKKEKDQVLVTSRKIDFGTEIQLEGRSSTWSYIIPFKDQASIENSVHAVLCALELGITKEQLTIQSQQLAPVAMRLQQLEGVNNCTLINDTYNSDITSLEFALNFLNIQHQHQKKTVILSDILQSGMKNEDLYKRVNELCKANGIDRLIGIGEKISSAKHCFSVDFISYLNRDEFFRDFRNLSFYDESILIKGARSFGFERISNLLENKKHETYAEINLSAILDNLNYFRSKLGKGVGMIGMVKAFSYGTGSFEIANILVHHGVDYLAVAYVDEGIALRKKGIEVPIMVMNPAIGEISSLAKYKLEAEVYNMTDLYIMDDFTQETGKTLKIHLKVESGMHRLGFELEQSKEVAEIVRDNKCLELASVFTHLVASDNPEHDKFTETQIQNYEAFCANIDKVGIGKYFKHVLNSDGIQRFEKYQFDKVRLGIGLYGITSMPETRDKLSSVVRLKSRISQIKEIRKGESVGYSRAFFAQKDMKIATVAIGYADGLVRKLGNGKWYFRIGGRKASIVGNVCMDMTMVDITGMENVEEKDEVVVYDGNSDIYKMAELRETIPYEILTSLSERVKRIYYYGE